MSVKAFLQGFLQGFNQAGGTQRLSSWAARKIADGKYYDPYNDPQFVQEYQSAAKSGSPAVQREFLNEYGDYLNYDIPGEQGPVKLSNQEKAGQVFGGYSAFQGPEGLSLYDVAQVIDPEGFESGRYKTLKDVYVPYGEFEDVAGAGLFMLGPERNLTYEKASTEQAKQGMYGGQEYMYRQHGDYYNEQALTEAALRPGEVEKLRAEAKKLKQEAYEAEQMGNYNEARAKKADAERIEQEINNDYLRSSAVDVGETLSSVGAPEEVAGSYRGVVLPATELKDIPLIDIATGSLKRDKLQSEIELANNAIVDVGEVLSGMGAPETISGSYRGVEVPITELKDVPMVDIATGPLQINELQAEINKINQEIAEIRANTQLTQAEKETEIALREAEKNRLIAETMAAEALAGEREARAGYYNSQKDYNNKGDINKPDNNFEVPGKWEPLGIDRWGNTNHQVYLDEGNFLRYPDGSYVTDAENNYWKWDSESRRFDTVNPGSDLNIPAYKEEDASGNAFINLLQGLYDNIFEDKSAAEENTEGPVDIRNMPLNQKANVIFEDARKEAAQKGIELTPQKLADMMESWSREKQQSFLNSYGLVDRQFPEIIKALRNM